MSGTIISVLKRTTLDFSAVPGAGSEERMIVPAIPVSTGAQLLVMVRVYSITIAGAQIIDFRVRNEAPSTDDPASDFVEVDGTTGSAVDLVTVQLTSATAPPIVAANAPAWQGSFLRLFARGTQSGGGGNLIASVAVDFLLQSSA